MKYPKRPETETETLEISTKDKKAERASPPIKVAEYHVGDKIKIYLSGSDGIFLCTFGKVIQVSISNQPTVSYVDYSGLPLHSFDRYLRKNEIISKGYFPEHEVKFKL